MALQSLLLVDSTGHGYLPKGGPATHGCGAATVAPGKVACIACGGSLVRKGSGGSSILRVLREWLLNDEHGMQAIERERPVCCRAVPAQDSVPQGAYAALEEARQSWRVQEAGPTIMQTAAASYGQATRALHFRASEAADAMGRVWEAARQSFPARPANTIDVVICCGWNCNDKEIPVECLAARKLVDAVTWEDFVREALTQAGTGTKEGSRVVCNEVGFDRKMCGSKDPDRPPFAHVAQWLRPAPAILYQTYKHDHAPAQAMCARHVPAFAREFVDYAGCLQDIEALGGKWLVSLYQSLPTGAHKCDMWRYVRLLSRGGNYLDIKMALARPWLTTLDEILADGSRTVDGHGFAEMWQMAPPSGAQQVETVRSVGQSYAQPGQSFAQPQLPGNLATTPFLVMSIGKAQNHIYQGNIWHASRSHPLLTEALQRQLRTGPKQLRHYLLFCKQLWEALQGDLGERPRPGWNWSTRYGPVYLFEEKMNKELKEKEWRDSTGVAMHVDGHFMYASGDERPYAATRAWRWRHEFRETKLAAMATAHAVEAAREQAGLWMVGSTTCKGVD